MLSRTALSRAAKFLSGMSAIVITCATPASVPAAARPVAAPAPVYKNAAAPIPARVDDLLARMTLAEKIVQITAVWDDKVKIFDSHNEFDAAKMAAAYPDGIGQFARPSDATGPGSPRLGPGRDAAATIRLVNALQRYALTKTRLGSFIARLLSNFPDKNFSPIDRDRYNRVMTTETEEIRDFLILHYKATERRDSAFWDRCRMMDVPARLQEKIDVFCNSGRTFRENEELFNDTSWFAVMAGQGLVPRTYDPVANLLSLAETQARLEQIKGAIAASADYMPGHRDFISQHCAA